MTRGGATLVQLRDKYVSDDELLAQAISLRDALLPHGVQLVVNDRVDVARQAGAGVHVGIHDMPPAQARAILGPNAIVGWSIEDEAQLTDTAQIAACSYLAASPVWSTPTKPDAAPPLGPDGVASIRMRTDLPLVGIGGIVAIAGGAIFVYVTVGSLLWGKKLAPGESSSVFTPVPRAAPTVVAQSYGSMGFAAPGTFTLAMIFLVTFVLYYFINWKYLSTLWGLS